MRSVYKDSLITVYKFTNPYNAKYIGMEFNVGEDSDSKYRGLPLTRANQKRLVKVFTTIAKRIGSLNVKS
jgi:hypothetical protein